MQPRMKCPICKRTVLSTIGETGEAFPFCSERCRLIDLGNWASESYKVPAPLSDMEEIPCKAGEEKNIAAAGHPRIHGPAQNRNGDGEAEGD